MNTETQNEVVTKEPSKSKRLSSFIWILVMWGIVRLYSELHPIYWTHLFFGVVVDSGLVPASVALFISMWMKRVDSEKILRWTAFGILVGVSSFGFLIQAMSFSNFRTIFIAMHWVLLMVGITGAYLRSARKEATHEH